MCDTIRGTVWLALVISAPAAIADDNSLLGRIERLVDLLPADYANGSQGHSLMVAAWIAGGLLGLIAIARVIFTKRTPSKRAMVRSLFSPEDFWEYMIRKKPSGVKTVALVFWTSGATLLEEVGMGISFGLLGLIGGRQRLLGLVAISEDSLLLYTFGILKSPRVGVAEFQRMCPRTRLYRITKRKVKLASVTASCRQHEDFTVLELRGALNRDLYFPKGISGNSTAALEIARQISDSSCLT